MLKDSLKIECEENCGNSPKKEQLKELTIAFVKNDVDFCIQHMTEDVVWNIIGTSVIEGMNNVVQALKQINDRKVLQLRIKNIITHGNTGSVNGTIMLDNHVKIDFCDVYNYRGFGKNAKIKKITSYQIDTSI